MRMPTTPTRDFSFMAGCWRTDPFKHERMQVQMGVSSYCFDANGYGSLEWRRGRTACRTSARAVFNGPNLALRDQAWLGLAREGYLFAAAVFFVCCFAMSRLSARLERRLTVDRRHRA